MAHKTLTFEFENDQITFDFFTGDVMINATQMAKPYGRAKRPDNFIRLQSTQDFIRALMDSEDFVSRIKSNYLTSEVVNQDISTDDLKFNIIRTEEGKRGGTYMCEELAIHFAQWLSPNFAVWISQTIRKVVFGCDSAKIREAVTVLPELYARKLEEEKVLRDLRVTLFGLDNIEQLESVDNGLKTIDKEIMRLSHYACTPTMFDNPEHLGLQIRDLAIERNDLLEKRAALIEKENLAKRKDEYIYQYQIVSGLRSEISSHVNQIKKNSFDYRNN